MICVHFHWVSIKEALHQRAVQLNGGLRSSRIIVCRFGRRSRQPAGSGRTRRRTLESRLWQRGRRSSLIGSHRLRGGDIHNNRFRHRIDIPRRRRRWRRRQILRSRARWHGRGGCLGCWLRTVGFYFSRFRILRLLKSEALENILLHRHERMKLAPSRGTAPECTLRTGTCRTCGAPSPRHHGTPWSGLRR